MDEPDFSNNRSSPRLEMLRLFCFENGYLPNNQLKQSILLASFQNFHEFLVSSFSYHKCSFGIWVKILYGHQMDQNLDSLSLCCHHAYWLFYEFLFQHVLVLFFLDIGILPQH